MATMQQMQITPAHAYQLIVDGISTGDLYSRQQWFMALGEFNLMTASIKGC